jgi:hypothetical protein
MVRYIKDYKPGKIIKSKDGFTYKLTAKYGDVDERMKNAIPPDIMLKTGIFSGKYLNDDKKEFPKEWFDTAKVSPNFHDININRFKVQSRLSLHTWKENGWIYGEDHKGWFQWWCRYYIGLRRQDIDEIQIKRWLSYKRHWSQLEKNLKLSKRWGDETFRPKQRQSLLQWAWKQPDIRY